MLDGRNERAATRLERVAQRRQAALTRGIGRIQHRAHDLREGGRETGDRPHRTGRESSWDEWLLADEDRQPDPQVRLDLVPWRLADLQASKVRSGIANAGDDLERDRVPAARGERVDEERERIAGARCRDQVRRERGIVEREIRGWNDGDRIGADLGGVRSELDGVGRRLRAAVDDQRPARRWPTSRATQAPATWR